MGEAVTNGHMHPHDHDDIVKSEIKDEQHDYEAPINGDGLDLHNRSDSQSPTSISPSSNLDHPHSANSKRTTRKSTLTQQQKNQKRQRATQDQLNTLEVEFNKNPTPNAAVRERIASEINMTERSVQIWFQNRRAKIKNLAKKSYETGEDPDIPESMRQYLHMQALESGQIMNMPDYFGPGGVGAYGPGLMINSETSPKVMITHLPCRSLNIGSWRRIGQTQLDLVVFYSPTKSMLTYYIQAESTGFRIEYPFTSIKNITLESSDQNSGAEVSSSESGAIIVELNQPPFFTMDNGSRGWFQCCDFSEDQQASKVLIHRLGGNPKALGAQLGKLTSCDAYRNRFEMPDIKHPLAHLAIPPRDSPQHSTHSTPGLIQGVHPPAPAFSAAPFAEPRPSSQPNQLVHPRAVSGPFPPRPFDMPEKMGPPVVRQPTRGHKRQRSSSVPMAINFGPRRQPMTEFTMQQHHHQHNHIHHHNVMANFNHAAGHIFSPTPQYTPQSSIYQPQASYGQMGAPLHIDVSSGFNFDFNTNSVPPPPSATTGTTPPSSEYEQSLYPAASMPDIYSAPPTQTTFGQQYLSPIIDSPSIAQHSISPSPNPNACQPTLQPSADLSPPATLFRSQSVDSRVHLSGATEEQFYQDNMFPLNAESFAENGKFINGFDDPKFNFVDDTNWGNPVNNNLEALNLDSLPRAFAHSRGPSLTLPFRNSQQGGMGFVPPPSPPEQDDPFAALIHYDPPTPHRERSAASVR